jgi:SpoIID/LytB domain protein
MTFETTDAGTVESGGKATVLGPGLWNLRLVQAQPPRRQFHVFAKTFKPSEETELQTYVSDWKGRGYPVEAVTLGHRIRTAQGHVLDCRQQWVSIQRFSTEAEANALRKRLEAKSVWAWIRPEVLEVGKGSATITGGAGRPPMTVALPLTLRHGQPVRVNAGVKKGEYAGELSIGVGPDSQLELFETSPVEDYLAGVLPSEMPALWPVEALKAQAVAARSDVLQHMAIKHVLEGFNFTDSEGDRVYGGHGGRHPNADQAVRETAGRVLTAAGRIVAATFSANCGGCTENNETVWSAPADPALRGVPDFPAGTKPGGGSPAAGMAKWLGNASGAYCSADPGNYRWSKRLTVAETTRLVNQTHRVGTVREIQLGDRGVSGRLKWVRITGTESSVTIRKELPIRQTFGGLPSAMFIIEKVSGSDGPAAFVFRGGGRGHGVGLCQQGARGMALAGKRHDDILAHYFTGATLESVE